MFKRRNSEKDKVIWFKWYEDKNMIEVIYKKKGKEIYDVIDGRIKRREKAKVGID